MLSLRMSMLNSETGNWNDFNYVTTFKGESIIMPVLLFILLAVAITVSSEKDDNYPWIQKLECHAPRKTFDPKSLSLLIPQHNQLTAKPIPYLSGFSSNPSWSQVGEDHAVYNRFFSDKKFVGNGFFLEIGGLDGATFSNTFLFEQALGWKGLNSNSRCVWHHELSGLL